MLAESRILELAVRIALLPLDSRPANWQFPLRLAACGDMDLCIPHREQLGSLHSGADRGALTKWLHEQVPCCDAAVLSLDALIYGGLVQSRSTGQSVNLDSLSAALSGLATDRINCYAYLTVPRLGISVDSSSALAHHELVREYFIAHGSAEARPEDVAAQEDLSRLSGILGRQAVASLWAWRRRNLEIAMASLDLCTELGFRGVHVAAEDNAPVGPHLAELRCLREKALKLVGSRGGIDRAPEFTFFDGADECACMLLARAGLDLMGSNELPVRIVLHPAAPGADNYRGLFETHSLGDGLDFLMRYLRLESRTDAQAVWLIAHGVQPQPDLFAADAGQHAANPYLIPEGIARFDASMQDLFVSDLCFCNGANPSLSRKVLELAGPALAGYIAFNTNFNTLGVTAALLSIFERGPRSHACVDALRRFLLERLADDVVYQAMGRNKVAKLLRDARLDPFSIAGGSALLDVAAKSARQTWLDWLQSLEVELHSAGLSGGEDMEFSFPWERAFECEASLPVKDRR